MLAPGFGWRDASGRELIEIGGSESGGHGTFDLLWGPATLADRHGFGRTRGTSA